MKKPSLNSLALIAMGFTLTISILLSTVLIMIILLGGRIKGDEADIQDESVSIAQEEAEQYIAEIEELKELIEDLESNSTVVMPEEPEKIYVGDELGYEFNASIFLVKEGPNVGDYPSECSNLDVWYVENDRFTTDRSIIITPASKQGKESAALVSKVIQNIKSKDKLNYDAGSGFSDLQYYCGGAAHFEVAELEIDVPTGLDAARATFFLGGTQFLPGHVTAFPVTIGVAAVKGTDLISMGKIGYLSDYMSQEQASDCLESFGEEGNRYQGFNTECLVERLRSKENIKDATDNANALLRFYEIR